MQLSKTVPTSQRILSALAEGGWILGFGCILLPVVIWILARASNPFTAHHAKQAFLWQLMMLGVIIVVTVAGALIVESPEIIAGVAIAVTLPWFAFSVYATFKALSGEMYCYPLLGRFQN